MTLRLLRDAQPQAILVAMTTSARRRLASSPFRVDPEPTIETYAVGDLVSHDSYGMGRVVHVETGAVTVDFRPKIVRIKSPYPKMAKL